MEKEYNHKWFGVPISPTEATTLYIFGIILLFGLIIGLISTFIFQFELVANGLYLPLSFYLPLILIVSTLILDIYTIDVAKKAR